MVNKSRTLNLRILEGSERIFVASGKNCPLNQRIYRCLRGQAPLNDEKNQQKNFTFETCNFL